MPGWAPVAATHRAKQQWLLWSTAARKNIRRQDRVRRKQDGTPLNG